MTHDAASALSFRDPQALHRWFAAHHADETELWVRLYRKVSGVPSVTWDDCVRAALAWGWIDGLKRPADEISWFQRLTPRRRGSSWSQRNRRIAEDLIEAGAMHPAGLAAVEAARQNGRWDAAGP